MVEIPGLSLIVAGNEVVKISDTDTTYEVEVVACQQDHVLGVLSTLGWEIVAPNYFIWPKEVEETYIDENEDVE